MKQRKGCAVRSAAPCFVLKKVVSIVSFCAQPESDSRLWVLRRAATPPPLSGYATDRCDSSSYKTRRGVVTTIRMDDNNFELEMAETLIAALQANHARGARAASACNTQPLRELRLRVPRRLWPRIGERVVAAAPSREYSAVVFLALDMPSPPDGPYIPQGDRVGASRGPAEG